MFEVCKFNVATCLASNKDLFPVAGGSIYLPHWNAPFYPHTFYNESISDPESTIVVSICGSENDLLFYF